MASKKRHSKYRIALLFFLLFMACSPLLQSIATITGYWTVGPSWIIGPYWSFSAPSVTVSLVNPKNQTYQTTTIPIEFTASGGTIDTLWFNVYDGSIWLYASNLTYSAPTSISVANGSTCTFYAWANNTDGNSDQETVMFSVLIPTSIIVGSESGPHFESTSTDWILTNGYLQLSINKTTTWADSFKYGDFELLPNDIGIAGNKWEVTFYFQNGTFRNFWGAQSYSYNVDSDAVNLTLNIKCDDMAFGGSGNANSTYANITYALFANKLVYEPHVFFNFTQDAGTVGNYTFHNFIATNIPDWNSLIIYGGSGAYAGLSQYDWSNIPNLQWEWSYKYLGNNNSEVFYGRPMAHPQLIYVRDDLAMSFYLTHYNDNAFWIVNNATVGRVYRTEFGKGFESQNAMSDDFNTSFTFKFFPLNSSLCWTEAVIDYVDSFASEYNCTTNQVINQTINKLNMMDIWPSQWRNTTFLDICKNMSATTLWLYGWQDIYENYPTDGNWTTRADSIVINATYMRDTIVYLQNLGFKVYLYMSNVFDFNTTSIPAYDGWLSKFSNGTYWYAWDLPADHVSVKMALSNATCRDNFVSLAQNLSTYYAPDGLALDLGSFGSQLLDIEDWQSGDYYLGVINVTQRLFALNITLIGNTGMALTDLWQVGTLFESPSYNSFEHLELLSCHLYNTTAWLLTTSIRPADQTVDAEIMWTHYALAAGMNRAFDYSANSLNNETLQTYVKSNYTTYWDSLTSTFKPVFWTLKPKDNNFLLGNNVFAGYLSDGLNLWIIAYNNGTLGTFDFPLYSMGNLEYTIQSVYSGESFGSTLVAYTYARNVTSLNLIDTYFTNSATIAASQFLVPFSFIFGMVGLGCMFVGPLYGITKIREKAYRNGFITMVIITALGFALFISWLWH